MTDAYLLQRGLETVAAAINKLADPPIKVEHVALRKERIATEILCVLIQHSPLSSIDLAVLTKEAKSAADRIVSGT